MKPTNYHLFDFLDFDPDLSRDESLWKAYKPTSVYEKDGDIVSIRPRACFFPLFSFLPLWLHYNLNPLCVQY